MIYVDAHILFTYKINPRDAMGKWSISRSGTTDIIFSVRQSLLVNEKLFSYTSKLKNLFHLRVNDINY